MIEFKNLSQEAPYIIFKERYDKALDAEQKNIEAISISSLNKEKNEVDSRFVNLKFVDNNKFIFFSNYNSPKSVAFSSHNQICALIYWPSINIQIRIKASIKKTTTKYNNEYFNKRSLDKNALAISSNQSQKILSYDNVIKKYQAIRKREDLLKCPNYWGGFLFVPYYFEFWEGHESRINKRIVFEGGSKNWNQYILEP
jgi:pyridoxamine 5'-phosphate oxidase